MFKIIASFILVGLWTKGLSQDLIIKTNGDEINAKVEEIDFEKVKYKKFDNLNGPIYNILKSELFMIKFQNGTKEMFNIKEITSNNNTDKIDIKGNWYCDITSQKYIILEKGLKYYIIENENEVGLVYAGPNKFSVEGSSQISLIVESADIIYFYNEKNEKLPLSRYKSKIINSNNLRFN